MPPIHDDSAHSFVAAGEKAPPGLVREFFLFLRENKKFWLIPLVTALLLLGGLVMLGGTAAAPFIYALF